MLKVISGDRTGCQRSVMDAVWRFRHRCFVEELGWEELRRPDGRERDAFDTPETIHMVLMSESDIVGYSRLLPTDRPHLLSEVFPNLAAKGPRPRGPRIFEWGRCAAMRGKHETLAISYSDLLMTAVLEYFVSTAVEKLVIEAQFPVIAMLRRRGYPLTVLGEPIRHAGHDIFAAIAYPSAELLRRHRQRHRIGTSLLQSVIGEGESTMERLRERRLEEPPQPSAADTP